jgi:hypothetical protein
MEGLTMKKLFALIAAVAATAAVAAGTVREAKLPSGVVVVIDSAAPCDPSVKQFVADEYADKMRGGSATFPDGSKRVLCFIIEDEVVFVVDEQRSGGGIPEEMFSVK